MSDIINIMTNTNDIITKIGDSIIQHGKFNDRIYLMKLSKEDFPNIIEKLNKIALKEKYTKIFAKVPEFAKDEFIKDKYVMEAHIPKFYNGYEDVYFMGKYFSKLRMYNSKIKEINEILDIVKNESIKSEGIKNEDINLPKGFIYKICDKSHIYQMADIYRKVFETYPFPIHDPQYIAKTMDENFIYFSIQKDGTIVSLSSAEMDINYQNVEMTDLATLSEYRGSGFASYLLYEMEDEMRKRDMKIAYTITRATLYSINHILYKMKYKYSGTLLNNTNISGSVESMNVWYKFI